MLFCRRVHPRLPQARRSGRRDPAIQDKGRDGLVQIIPHAPRRRVSVASSQTPSYTPWHPRWYRQRVSTWWWLGSWHYLKFILREISSIFVALAVGMTLLQIAALRLVPAAYERMQSTLRSPLSTIV